MTKRYAEQSISLSVEIRDDAGALADPTSVAFTYRIGRYGDEEAGATVTKTATGKYSTTITPEEPGILYGTWKTTGTPLRAIPAKVPIYPNTGIVG